MYRGVSRAAATSKMECLVIIVNGFQPLTIITRYSILDVTAALDPPLMEVRVMIVFAICFSSFKSSRPEVFLGKGVLKIQSC